MKIKYTIICLFILLFFACSNNKESGNGFQYTIKVESIEKDIHFDEIISEYDLIQLETNDNCLLGDITDIIVEDKQFIILSNNQIYCFDMNGRFIQRIGAIGKGPGEYIHIKSINIDAGILYVVDFGQYAIHSYHLNSGKFISSYRVPTEIFYDVDEINVINNKLYVYKSNTNSYKYYEIYQIDNFIKPIKKINNSTHIYGTNHFYHNGNIYNTDKYKYQVFKINQDGNFKYIQYDFGISNLTQNEINLLREDYREAILKIKNENKVLNISKTFETSNTIVSSIVKSNYSGIIQSIFNKNNNTNTTIDIGKLNAEDFQFKPYLISATDNNKFYTIYDNDIAADVEEPEKITDKYPAYKRISKVINNWTFGNNPIIAIYQFKEVKGR